MPDGYGNADFLKVRNDTSGSSSSFEKLDSLYRLVDEVFLETSEGVNAIELEYDLSVGIPGIKGGINIAFGVDNKGRVDLAVGVLGNPNSSSEIGFTLGGNLAKARDVNRVSDLLNGRSDVVEAGRSMNFGPLNATAALGTGYTRDAETGVAQDRVDQYSFSLGVKAPRANTLYTGADIESAYSFSEYFNVDVNLGFVGKALYSTGNIIYGNLLDSIPLSHGNKK